MTQDPDGFTFSVSVRMAAAIAAGVVFNAHYLGWCDDARFAFLAAIGQPFVPGRSTSLAMVRHAELDWLVPLHLFDNAEISVLVDRVGGTSYTLRYDICRAGESEPVRASARVTYVEVDLGTGRPAPLPEELRSALLTAAARCA